MVFNSLHYLFFLPVVVILFYLLPPNRRWILILLASCYFYMVWKPIYILLILFSCGIDYFCAIRMGDIPDKKARRPYLFLSLISNLSILGLFKYYDFFATSINQLFVAMGMDYSLQILHLILPWGISFYTFQALSYIIDVYKGRYIPEKRGSVFSIYVIFFPQLVAGPIERASHMMKQYHFNTPFLWSNMIPGLRLILLGLFKKVAIADQLGPMISYVFDNPQDSHGLSVYLGCALFTQQVYCDFSGYSDIARGTARLIGVDLIENFKLPFFSNSYVNFWSRWHISLMNWFRDYILFPLIKGGWKWPLVFMIIFLISGVWHGANWTFIIWGIVNGLMVLYSRATLEYRSKFLDKIGLKKFTGLRNAVQSFCVFNMFAIGALPFRSKDLEVTLTLASNFVSGFGSSLSAIWNNVENARHDFLFLGQDAVGFLLVIGLLFLLECFQWNLRHRTLDQLLNNMSRFKRFALYVFATLVIIYMSNVPSAAFIYFQF